MAKKSRQQKDEERRKAEEEERADQARKPMSTVKILTATFVLMLLFFLPIFAFATLDKLQRIRYANVYGYSRVGWLASAIWTIFLVAVTYLLLRKTKKIERGEQAWRVRRNGNVLLAALVGAGTSLFVGHFAGIVNDTRVLGVEKRRFKLIGCSISHSYKGGSGEVCNLSDSLGRSHLEEMASDKDDYFYGPTRCFDLNLNIGLFAGRYADKKIRPEFLPDSECPDMIYWGDPPNSWYTN